MIENWNGGYRRKPKERLLEIEVKRSDDYLTFANKAASALQITVFDGSQLSLFKTSNGAAIVNDILKINDQWKPWTLGNYLRLLKKSWQYKDWMWFGISGL